MKYRQEWYKGRGLRRIKGGRGGICYYRLLPLNDMTATFTIFSFTFSLSTQTFLFLFYDFFFLFLSKKHILILFCRVLSLYVIKSLHLHNAFQNREKTKSLLFLVGNFSFFLRLLLLSFHLFNIRQHYRIYISIFKTTTALYLQRLINYYLLVHYYYVLFT